MGYTYHVPQLEGLDEKQRIALALEAVRASPESNGYRALSLRQAAKDFKVPRSTLTSRYNGVHTRELAHESQQKLTAAEEAVLVDWIKVQGRRGVPISPATLADHASAIAGVRVGHSWPQRFMKRHPDLRTRWTRSLEKCRANNVNKATVNQFYDILQEVITNFDIPAENIYNMDEKGVQLGVGKRVAAIVDRDQKEVYNIENGDRELVTVIETVSADGTALNPSVIFKGARIQSKWGQINPCGASISCSPNGWTDQELGLLWLEKDFEPMSRARNTTGGYRLLVLDGHNSHCTYRFCEFAEKHNIIVVCLPSHTTHVLQPCDVCIFGPLASSWKSEVNSVSRTSGCVISKSNFLEHYANARARALRETTIKKGFEKTGIWPLNREALDPIVFEPALNTTTQGAQPLVAQLPTYIPIELLPAAIDNSTPHDQPSGNPSTTPRAPRERFRITLPAPVTPTASRQELRDHVNLLLDLLRRCGQQIEADYSQMKLMDVENARLHKIAFQREEKKGKKGKDKRSSAEARHMTSSETLEHLARAEWEVRMEDVHKELRLKEKEINDHNKKIEAEEKRERAFDKKTAVAQKKAAAQIEKDIGQWQRSMSALATFLLEEEKKEQKAKAKAKPKPKQPPVPRSTRKKQKSALAQQLREIGTPKRPRRVSTRRRKPGGDPEPSVDETEASESESELSTSWSNSDADVSDPPPPPPPRPRPRPRPRPIRKGATILINEDDDEPHPTIPFTPMRRLGQSINDTDSLDQGSLQSLPIRRSLFNPPSTPMRGTQRTPTTSQITLTPIVSIIPRPALPTPARAPRRMLRFEIQPTILDADETEDPNTLPSPSHRTRHTPQSQAALVGDVVAVVEPLVVPKHTTRSKKKNSTPHRSPRPPVRRSGRKR